MASGRRGLRRSHQPEAVREATTSASGHHLTPAGYRTGQLRGRGRGSPPAATPMCMTFGMRLNDMAAPGARDLPTAWAEQATTPVPRELREFPRRARQERALTCSTAAMMALPSAGTATPATRTVGVASTPAATARAVTKGGQSR